MQTSSLSNTAQHLYFLSDEETKEDDWVCNIEIEPSIIQCIGKGSLRGWKKIIATTDSSLKVLYEGDINNSEKDFGKIRASLPKPSQDFIKVFVEEYNKGNIIEWVDVEYEEPYKELVGSKIGSNIGHFTLTEENKYRLKINSKNEISIRKIKENWSREEVINLFNKMFATDIIDANVKRKNFDEWISENL